MLSKDKELMEMHLDTIYKEICNLTNEEDRAFTWRLNCNLIDIRENIRDHIKELKTRECGKSVRIV